jgi:hypothetical protein
LRNVRPKQIAAGHVRNPETFFQQFGLGAFTRAGRSEQNDVHAST